MLRANADHSSGSTGRRRANSSQRGAHLLAERVVADRAAREADDREARRQQAIARQAVERGQQLAVRRSPDAPKITITAGSGTRSSASPSRSGLGSTARRDGAARASSIGARPTCARGRCGLAGQRVGERLQPGVDVGAQVDAQRAAAAALEHLQIAQRLRVAQGGEGVALAGDGQIGRRVRGQLQEDARVRAALVQLAGRVQEARAVADGRRVARAVAAGDAHAGQRASRAGVRRK